MATQKMQDDGGIERKLKAVEALLEKRTRTTVDFEALGVQHSLPVTPLGEWTPPQGAPSSRRRPAAGRALLPAPRAFDPEALVARLGATGRMRSRVPNASVTDLGVTNGFAPGRARAPRADSVPPLPSPTVVLLTPTIIVEGSHTDDLKAALNAGARILEEGYDGKTLLGVDKVEQVAGIVALLQERNVGSVGPNFLRRFERTPLSVRTTAWAPTLIRVEEAWQITRGNPEIKIAVLDEGVDTSHVALAAAVVGERDFIGDNGDLAMPDGNDAHGTACAGIVLSRGGLAPGVAPGCSLLAARIAMDDGSGGWVFDDYATADAIDWAWRAGAAVISNSWGGGPASDSISRAFGRARTQGRGGRGTVVCIAAGNDQRLAHFPGSLPGYVTVGASNQADMRKTRTSTDGEPWGSCYGPTLWLMAPGVSIHTTDISGTAGYENGDYTETFNGTSAATPHVAGAAGLMLSINPGLSGSDVRALLASTAVPIEGQTGRTDELGHGRLDVAAAVAAAQAHP